MSLLEAQVAATSRAGAWESIPLQYTKGQVDTQLLTRLRKPLGATRADQALQRAIALVAVDAMDRGRPLLGQIRNDRVAAASWAVGQPRGKRAGTSSVKVPRWQVLIILSSAAGGMETPEAFVNEVSRRCEKLLQPALLGA